MDELTIRILGYGSDDPPLCSIFSNERRTRCRQSKFGAALATRRSSSEPFKLMGSRQTYCSLGSKHKSCVEKSSFAVSRESVDRLFNIGRGVFDSITDARISLVQPALTAIDCSFGKSTMSPVDRVNWVAGLTWMSQPIVLSKEIASSVCEWLNKNCATVVEWEGKFLKPTLRRRGSWCG